MPVLYLSACLYVCLSYIGLSGCLSYKSVCMSACLISLSIRLSVRPSIRMSVRPSACLSVCLSVFSVCTTSCAPFDVGHAAFTGVHRNVTQSPRHEHLRHCRRARLATTGVRQTDRRQQPVYRRPETVRTPD